MGRSRLFCGNRFNGEAITPDDGPKWVSLGTVTQKTGKRWIGQEMIALAIWPREATEE